MDNSIFDKKFKQKHAIKAEININQKAANGEFVLQDIKNVYLDDSGKDSIIIGLDAPNGDKIVLKLKKGN